MVQLCTSLKTDVKLSPLHPHYALCADTITWYSTGDDSWSNRFDENSSCAVDMSQLVTLKTKQCRVSSRGETAQSRCLHTFMTGSSCLQSCRWGSASFIPSFHLSCISPLPRVLPAHWDPRWLPVPAPGQRGGERGPEDSRGRPGQRDREQARRRRGDPGQYPLLILRPGALRNTTPRWQNNISLLPDNRYFISFWLVEYLQVVTPPKIIKIHDILLFKNQLTK